MTSLLVLTFTVSGIHTLLWLPRALKMKRDKRKMLSSPAEKDTENKKKEDSAGDKK
jgi:hypothetical protein